MFIVASAVVAFLCVQIVWGFGAFNLVENTLRDVRFGNIGEKYPPENIVIVDFPEWRSDKRAQVAEVIRALGEGGASAIVVDILLDEAWDEEGDRALSDAIRDTPNVILAMQIESKAGRVVTVSPPLGIFSKYAWGVGFANLLTDPDDRIVREALLLEGEDQTYASIAALGAALANGAARPDDVKRVLGGVALGGVSVRTTPQDTIFINYFGGKNAYDPETGSSRVFTDDLVRNMASLGLMSPNDSPFTDKIMLVGSTSEHTKDLHRIPFDTFQGESSRTPGIIVQANIIGNLLTPDRTIPDYRHLYAWITFLTALLMSALFVMTSNRLSVWVSAVIAIAAIGAGILVQFYSFPACAISILPALGAIPLCFFGGVYYRFLDEKGGKEMMRDLFGYYLSHDLAGAILDDPSLIRMGGYEALCTFLICDIDSFSTLSENLDPHSVVDLLNVFFSEMHSAIKANRGWLNKYLGDGMLVVFGAPLYDEFHADGAVATALEMRYRINKLKLRIEDRFGIKDFNATIGVHTGDACIGNIGSPDRMEYTVIGDAVNVCARIVDKAKEVKVDVVISQDTKDSLHSESRCEEVGAFIVKGRNQTVVIYRLG
jgi:adenylate cyclase